jgi:acyl carrier protein
MIDIRDRLRAFISGEILYDDGSQLTDETPLLGGVLDSLALFQLVSFIEQEFDVSIDDSEVTVTNFQTISAIDRLVRDKSPAS